MYDLLKLFESFIGQSVFKLSEILQKEPKSHYISQTVQFSVCVCVCVCVYVCACKRAYVCVHVCAYVCEPRFPDMGLHWNPDKRVW